MEEKLLNWCYENFDFDTQKWICDSIPDEILDYSLSVMRQGGPKLENGCENDFILDFIYDEIVDSKYGKITKLYMKELFEDETKRLFD